MLWRRALFFDDELLSSLLLEELEPLPLRSLLLDALRPELDPNLFYFIFISLSSVSESFCRFLAMLYSSSTFCKASCSSFAFCAFSISSYISMNFFIFIRSLISSSRLRFSSTILSCSYFCLSSAANYSYSNLASAMSSSRSRSRMRRLSSAKR